MEDAPATATTRAEATRAEATREALLGAAIQAFGRDGYHAVTTKALAASAGVNQALISYHFGGKAGLYQACFAHIAERIEDKLGPVIGEITATAGARHLGAPSAAERPARARELCCLIVDALARLMTSPETRPWARLILREQQDPTATSDLLYEGVMGRMLTLLTGFVAAARGRDRPGRDDRLLALMLIGQVQVFRTATATVLRHTGWKNIGPAQTDAIRARLRDNLMAILAGEPNP